MCFYFNVKLCFDIIILLKTRLSCPHIIYVLSYVNKNINTHYIMYS